MYILGNLLNSLIPSSSVYTKDSWVFSPQIMIPCMNRALFYFFSVLCLFLFLSLCTGWDTRYHVGQERGEPAFLPILSESLQVYTVNYYIVCKVSGDPLIRLSKLFYFWVCWVLSPWVHVGFRRVQFLYVFRWSYVFLLQSVEVVTHSEFFAFWGKVFSQYITIFTYCWVSSANIIVGFFIYVRLTQPSDWGWWQRAVSFVWMAKSRGREPLVPPRLRGGRRCLSAETSWTNPQGRRAQPGPGRDRSVQRLLKTPAS